MIHINKKNRILVSLMKMFSQESIFKMITGISWELIEKLPLYFIFYDVIFIFREILWEGEFLWSLLFNRLIYSLMQCMCKFFLKKKLEINNFKNIKYLSSIFLVIHFSPTN